MSRPSATGTRACAASRRDAFRSVSESQSSGRAEKKARASLSAAYRYDESFANRARELLQAHGLDSESTNSLAADSLDGEAVEKTILAKRSGHEPSKSEDFDVPAKERKRGRGRPLNRSKEEFWTRVGLCAEVITALSKRYSKRRSWLTRGGDERFTALCRELIMVYAETLASAWERFGLRDRRRLMAAAIWPRGDRNVASPRTAATEIVRWVMDARDEVDDPAPRNLHTRLAQQWLNEQGFVERASEDLGTPGDLSLQDIEYGKKLLRERDEAVRVARKYRDG